MTKQTAALFSVISNTCLIVLKIIAGIAMGSVSVISEAIHSGIDLLASCIAFFSIRQAVQPADSDHPYGHGKFENISGFAEAMLIFVAAGMIIYEAVKKIIHPVAVENLDWGIAVMLVSVVMNTFVSRLLYKVAKKENSIALEADAMHLSVDVLTSLGVLIGLVVIRFTHLTILDPIIAFAVAAMILRASWSLTRRAIEDLADKALPENEQAMIKELVAKYPQVLDYHRLRTRKSGNQREIDIHIKVDKTMMVGPAHDVCSRIEKDIRDKLPGTYVVTHLEPYG